MRDYIPLEKNKGSGDNYVERESTLLALAWLWCRSCNLVELFLPDTQRYTKEVLIKDFLTFINLNLSYRNPSLYKPKEKRLFFAVTITTKFCKCTCKKTWHFGQIWTWELFSLFHSPFSSGDEIIYITPSTKFCSFPAWSWKIWPCCTRVTFSPGPVGLTQSQFLWPFEFVQVGTDTV